MTTNTRKVIFTMVGKGGVGKSTTSVWLHQFLSDQGYPVTGYDTDPVNATYDAFQSLDTQHINIYNDKNEIDKSLFDELIERYLLNLPENGIAIVDNGATSFNAMLTYIDENSVIELLADYGVDTLISVPVVGGSEHYETLRGLVALHKQFDCQKIIWLNRFFGDMPDGKEDPESTIPKLLGDSLAGLVEIPDKNADTFGKAIKEMQKRRLTFDEFYSDEKIGLMARNRIKNFKAWLYEELAAKLPFPPVSATKTAAEG